MLLKLNELNSRANRAEQRVLELEQVLRQHALGALDDTCDDSDIVTCASQHNFLNEVNKHLRYERLLNAVPVTVVPARFSSNYLLTVTVECRCSFSVNAKPRETNI